MVFLTILLSTGLLGYAVGVCTDGWVQHGSSCYHFSHDKEPWDNAYDICKILGGSLLQIEDANENAYITSQLSSYGNGKFEPFIALSDLAEENIWVWMVSSSKLDSTSYTNWSPGEPNNDDGKENCVNLKSTGKWNDAECYSSRYYICEKLDDGGVQVVG